MSPKAVVVTNEQAMQTMLVRNTLTPLFVNIHCFASNQELLTGKQPFSDFKKEPAVIHALGKGERPRRPKRILDQSARGARFWDILQKCWAQSPADRPTANEVATLVREFVISPFSSSLFWFYRRCRFLTMNRLADVSLVY